MKRILIGILLVFLSVTLAGAWQWQKVEKTFAASGANQEVLAVGADYYCVVEQVKVVNEGVTNAALVQVHWEGTVSASNIILSHTCPVSGGGMVWDDLWLVGSKGLDIDVDISATTDIRVEVKYALFTRRPSPR